MIARKTMTTVAWLSAGLAAACCGTAILALAGEGAPPTPPSSNAPLTAAEKLKFSEGTLDVVKLTSAIVKVRALHRKLDVPRPGEWLYEHKEPGQTFLQYIRSGPVTPRGKRNIIYIQPLGEFTATQRKVLKLTADYMRLYFGVKVETRRDLPLSLIPAKARRTHPATGDKQILTSYVLRKVLKPRLPEDAACYLALTASDLWPGEGWNFVFGQASLRERIGVWSIYRNGNPDDGEKAFRLCLRRTISTATHETGHMFGMLHCTAYECNMCGSNSRAEADRRPIWVCPECMAKVCWASGCEPVGRYQGLWEFFGANGMKDEQEFVARAAHALGETLTTRPANRRVESPSEQPERRREIR